MAKSLLCNVGLPLLGLSAYLLGNALAVPTQKHVDRAAWPYGPLVTDGRDIKDTNGDIVVYAGTNWPGAADVMIPEGLQYQSIESIVSKIKSLGMNAIRLTYAIELIDQIYDNGGEDVAIETALANALGAANGSAVLEEILTNNPSFTASTTRLEVYDAIAAECATQEIYVHLDNHMSKGEWCCSTDDGNGWFGDTYFSVANWTRGLSYMADHGKSWPALVSMSLRNELRSPDDNATLTNSSYNWEDWYKYTKEGTEAINSNNEDVLIFLSGLDFDTWLTPVVQGTALTPGTETFTWSDFDGYTDKLVLELHNYASTTTNCTSLQQSLYDDGFQALHPEDEGTVNVFPVALTEFGFQQNATTWEGVYPTCIASFLSEEKTSWFIWVVAGSYYIRSGVQDVDESWGLLTHDWSAWRSQEYVDGGLIPLPDKKMLFLCYARLRGCGLYSQRPCTSTGVCTGQRRYALVPEWLPFASSTSKGIAETEVSSSQPVTPTPTPKDLNLMPAVQSSTMFLRRQANVITFAANCRFEHPGANPSPFGGATNNRFNALSSGGGSSGGAFGRAPGASADGTNAYKITKDALKIDLVDERPQWILSAYGPGRDAPEQLFGGYPREQSFEEIRLMVATSPNPQQTLQEVQNMYIESEKQMQTALGNLDGAVQFILAAENKHPNRHDICKQNTLDGGANGSFGVGVARSGFGANPLSAGPAANQNPFAATQPSPFGAPAAAAPPASAFGQPSQIGVKPNPFGQPASTGASAFGQPSSLGAKPNPFAAAASAPSGFAAAAQQQNNAFGQPSTLGAKPNPFGAPAAASPFGAPSQPPNANPFGAPSQASTASPFGAPSQPPSASPFGAPTQPAATNPFGATPSQPSNASPFGAPSQPSNASPFGAPSQPSRASPFGAPSQSSAPAANPFGQSPAPPSAFGTAPAAANPFSAMNSTPMSQGMDTQPTPAAPRPFGQPVTHDFGSLPNSTASGLGGFAGQPAQSATQAAQTAPAGPSSPYPPGSAKQHPNVDSYVSKMGTRIIRFKNQPVSYRDDKPGVQVGGHWSKIWFPNGPLNYYAGTEPQDKSAYTDAVHRAYEESARTGRFTDLIPEVPPMREDCVWDF
ncbi:hypothetical protein SCUP234_01172 [Seiridium cupressi]